MFREGYKKYQPFSAIELPNRQWPSKTIDTAPRWASVDLRDGNQALIDPMDVNQKLELWQLLVDVGFKEIEVGFPAASGPDFEFVRRLIDEGLIPYDVTIQVLTQAREVLIDKTFEALKGAKNACVHLYNSTSTVQRRDVFKLSEQGIIDIAVKGAQIVLDRVKANTDTAFTLQYSPESFTGTELPFAVKVVDAVTQVWSGQVDSPIIINLPSTVEMATPNVYADQIEWFCTNVARRDELCISLHTHNDRGCAVAAAELAVMAGADRVEGTLLGNGERTGNMDIVTMGMNLYSQGIDPNLDFGIMDRIIHTISKVTNISVHPRHPYAGELVFTAFSGSHQDAIKKCLDKREQDAAWDVAYLPIDPADLGRSYQEVIRVNSQSGKGGAAWILQHNYGFDLPRWVQVEFSASVQAEAESSARELSVTEMYALFCERFMQGATKISVHNYSIQRSDAADMISVEVGYDQVVRELRGNGRGLAEAFVAAYTDASGIEPALISYAEHSLGDDTDAEAAAYVELSIDGRRYIGVGVDRDLSVAPMKAILIALEQAGSLSAVFSVDASATVV